MGSVCTFEALQDKASVMGIRLESRYGPCRLWLRDDAGGEGTQWLYTFK